MNIRNIFKLIERCLKKGLSFDHIALALGISRVTLYRHIEKNEALCNTIKRGR